MTDAKSHKTNKIKYSWDVPQRSLPRVIFGLIILVISSLLSILITLWLLIPDKYIYGVIDFLHNGDPKDEDDKSDLLYFIPDKKYGTILALMIMVLVFIGWPASYFLNFFLADQELKGERVVRVNKQEWIVGKNLAWFF